MVPVPETPTLRGEPASILVHGSGTSALTMLALGLACRSGTRPVWANCSPVRSIGEPTVREAVDRYAVFEEGTPLRPGEFERTVVRPDVFDRLIQASDARSRESLIEYLSLPPLLQRILVNTDRGLPSVVISRSELLPSELMADTVGFLRDRGVLQRRQLTLVATFHGPAPTPIRPVFDRIFRVEQVGPGRWADALVWSERGPTDIDLLLPQPLRGVWAGLGLDSALLAQ